LYQREIQDSAYRHQQLVESGDRVIVGVNRFTESSQRAVEILRVGSELEAEQVERLQQLRARRDAAVVARSLDIVRRTAEGTDNLLPIMREALAALATVGEICDALRDVFGVHRPGGAF
jgi:methylmalonyl-CoA mutase, N-terminal domain